MIVPEYTAIINIEVKRGSNDSSDKLKFQKEKLNLLKEASKQTKQHFSFMQKLFGGMLSKDWVFVRAACVPYLEIVANSTMPCGNCQKFILLEKDVDHEIPWFKQLINNKLIKSQYFYQTVYENLLAELIYHISIKESSKFNKLILDPLIISRETEKAFTGKSEGIIGECNVPAYMLNNEQLQAVHSPAKFLIIDGDYGTGKTYVLKERAKKCARDNSKDQLFYIDITAITHKLGDFFRRAESSFMNNIAVLDFDSHPNIKVITIKDLGISDNPEQTDIINALNSFLRDNHCDHVFIDEMIIGEIVIPDSIETMCMNLKVIDWNLGDFENKKAKWLETMKVDHNAVHVNLTKNMRNSQQIIHLAKAVDRDSTQQMSCSPDTNIMGNHNFYYRNVHDIELSLLVVAAVNKYFIHKPKESVVILSDNIYYIDRVFQLLHKHFSSTTSVVRNVEEYMKKPEGILVTDIGEFQGAQARNVIIFDSFFYYTRNTILRTISLAIIILENKNNKLISSVAFEDKNLHEYIYPEGKAPECHHYHNEYKHDISALTLAILEKYKLFDQDERITIITYSRISKDVIREANTKEFLSLPREEREKHVRKKIKLENRKLYEDVKRNISRNYPDISWSYYHTNFDEGDLKDLVNKPKHVNYINIGYVSEILYYDYYKFLNKFKNTIVFADENVNHKYEFAAWGNEYNLNYSDNGTSIKVDRSKTSRNNCEALSRDAIWEAQPKFALVVHDGNLGNFSQPKEALNLIEDENLHEYIPVDLRKRKNCIIL